jgi:hypothetical protein
MSNGVRLTSNAIHIIDIGFHDGDAFCTGSSVHVAQQYLQPLLGGARFLS